MAAAILSAGGSKSMRFRVHVAPEPAPTIARKVLVGFGAAGRMAALAVTGLALSSCDGSDAVSPAPEGRIFVSPAVLAVVVHGSAKVNARAFDASGRQIPAAALTWSSSDTTVAVVDDAGTVYGRTLGTAVISVAHGALRGTTPVSVRPGLVRFVSVASRIIAPGTSVDVAAEILDANGEVLTGSVPGITWRILQPDIVTVQPVSGASTNVARVTGLRWGKASIAATAWGVQAVFALLVSPSAAEGDPYVNIQFRVIESVNTASQSWEYVPVVEVATPPDGPRVDVLRVDMLIPGLAEPVTSACGSLAMMPGVPQSLFGVWDYEWELAYYFDGARPVTGEDAALLLSYRNDVGQTRGLLVRGPVQSGLSVPPLPRVSSPWWNACY